ncbi:ketoacyl-ACP synthase III [Flavobacterium sp.]|uniref:3-oxoacyl-ACP synthase III family protein n=1 Tax=Flavobacterium sp. TaxID=239 RepID=UPI00286DB843|nr:ketoacyl-ACP synthase III [Flavobacterium sp.]
MNSKITGVGCYIPELVKTNKDFMLHQFYDEKQHLINLAPEVIAQKFESITGIQERRYVSADMQCSDMAAFAAEKALSDANCDRETIDQIIVAHNFGDVVKHTIQTDAVPAVASRVKHKLGIKNPNCIAYDILFGCPGWLQGMIQAHAFLQTGVAKKCLVIGAEALSRVLDQNDRDSMIFADGAGAVIIESTVNEAGVLSFSMQSHCLEELDYLNLGKSNYPESDPRIRFIKMKGRKVYEYAIKHVPLAMKECIDKSGLTITDIKKIFIHQANEKLDEAIIRELYKLYGLSEFPNDLMPMNIHKLGNSSVATIPTLYAMVKNKEIEGFEINEGDVILFASVGAGMNINAMCYRV